jgi:DegV family protein with EDD domain
MRIGLVTDSPCDLPADLVNRHQITVIPAVLVLEGQSYLDGVEITREAFYTRLPALRIAPTTAAPAQLVFTEQFRRLLSEGCEHVIAIFTAEKLTSMSLIARSAAAGFPGQVSVLESGSLSLGIGYQVLASAEAIERQLPLPQVMAAIQSTRERLRIYAALDTIEYLRRSGRVPHAIATLGGLLRIKPVVELHEGVVRALGAPRTTRQATDKLFSLLDGLGSLEKLSILHTNAEERAAAFLERLKSSFGDQLPVDIRLVNVTTVIGTHVGPNGLGLAIVKR